VKPIGEKKLALNMNEPVFSPGPIPHVAYSCILAGGFALHDPQGFGNEDRKIVSE
jgi:hypothetical protein